MSEYETIKHQRRLREIERRIIRVIYGVEKIKDSVKWKTNNRKNYWKLQEKGIVRIIKAQRIRQCGRVNGQRRGNNSQKKYGMTAIPKWQPYIV